MNRINTRSRWACRRFRASTAEREWHLLMAASALVCLPVLILFFLTQRTFIQGIATTGGK
jgi:multiple sugar transport system permease protein